MTRGSSDRDVANTLERHYRRILACYPSEHRLTYEEEMLGVLMAGAGPGQRYPTLGEALSLIRAAARARISWNSTGPMSRQWRDAAALLGLIGAILLATKHVRPLSADLVWSLRFDDALPFPAAQSVDTVWKVAGWAVIAIAAIAGWRAIAAVGAWCGVLAELILLSMQDPGGPVTVVGRLWPVTLAVVVAAALTAPATRGRASDLLRRRGLVLVAAAGLIGIVGAAAEPLLATAYPGFIVIDPRITAALLAGTAAVMLILIFAATSRLDPTIRRRLLALAASALTLFGIVRLAAGPAAGGGLTNPGVLPSLAWWILLAVAPVVVLIAGLSTIRRQERGKRVG